MEEESACCLYGKIFETGLGEEEEEDVGGGGDEGEDEAWEGASPQRLAG